MAMTRSKRKTPSDGVFDCSGRTTEGAKYKSIDDMWTAELASGAWYQKSDAFWREQTPSVDGMLGGLGDLDECDVNGSRQFLHSILALNDGDGAVVNGVALDVGAGIGRVTRHLLLPMFTKVDMLEQNKSYLEKSVAFLRDAHPTHIVERSYCVGMQNFTPDEIGRNRYAVVWIQWCIIYLTDDDLVEFLRQCVQCLASDGMICIKDNLTRSGFLVDAEDSSISRSDKYLKALFERAGLRLLHERRQLDFPKKLFPVKMYALRPNRE